MRKKDLETAVVIGDRALGSFLIFRKFIFDFPLPKNKEVEIYGLLFPSPIISASFKSDHQIIEMWLRLGLGGVILKTIMQEKRTGNPRPRLQDAYLNGEKGLINSLGLPGSGINSFTETIKGAKLWEYDRPIGISVGGENSLEYLDNVKKIDSKIHDIKKQYFYELNISCPNTENGQTICQDPIILESLLKDIRSVTDKVISVKVSPDVSNKILQDIGALCANITKVLINAGNTIYVKPGQVGVDKYNYSMNGGGLSGSPLFKRTLEMVHLFSKFNIPVMATGGISSFEHIVAAKSAGASLFGMATSLVFNPYCIPKINSKL
tara:strand:+ start:53 stop:1018 length:966 start_codon:yes stop_codon:yes gene_type:complete